MRTPTAQESLAASATKIQPFTGQGTPRWRRVLLRVLLGANPSPRWERPALTALLVLTTLLYTLGLDINGWANSYYSAAVMAGSQDWTAFFYGSSDPGNAITVDKPPVSLWVMSITVRLFGLNSWSLLVPQALMGVLTVFVMYKLVRMRFGAATGLLAATLMAVTPVSTVMFRYNNPDALLILLMVGIAFSALKSIDREQPKWIVLAGALVGAGFLTKQLQIGLILPALIVTYLVFARTTWPKRFIHLTLAGFAAIVVSGSWLLAVQLSDSTERPFIGGSRNNSAIELALGYNGLGRLTGEDASRTLSGPTATLAQNPDPGFHRFLQPQLSGQFGWFIPFAVVGLAITVWYLCKRHNLKATNALLLFSSIWFVTATTVVAYMSGILHPYYSLTSVPPMCCLASIGLIFLTRRHRQRWSRAITAVTLAGSLVVAFITAVRSTVDFPFLPLVIAMVGGLTLAFQLLPPPTQFISRVSFWSLTATLLLGPVLWSINTAASPHVGAGVIAGPSILGVRSDHPARNHLSPDLPDSVAVVMFGDTLPPDIVRRARDAAEHLTWAAATVGSETAANLQLDSGRAVLPVGGFDGTDPYPTLEDFQLWVNEGRVGALVLKNLPPLTLAGRGESARIVEWVRSHYVVEVIEGTEFYDLTR